MIFQVVHPLSGDTLFFETSDEAAQTAFRISHQTLIPTGYTITFFDLVSA